MWCTVVEVTTKQKHDILVLGNDRQKQYLSPNIREMSFKEIPKTAALF